MNRLPANTAAQLTDAFAEFEEASRSLSTFYRDLERRVGELTRELAASRTAQARELAEKQRLAARLENLLEALPGGVVVLDQRGRVQACNPVATELLGTVDNGEAWSAVVARAFAPRWDDGHDISLVDGRRVNIATQALSGEPGQILLLNDVTETRRLHEQLAHHKRLSAKTEMAAAMAHQIRTPLAAALLSAGNLRRARDDGQRERAIDRTVKGLRKLERLVDEMLLFARGGQLEMAPLGASELFAALGDAAREAFNYGEYVIAFDGGAPAGTVHVNLAALTSIALNLIENAHQAAGGRGRIAITANRVGGVLELAFADDGPGIPAELAATVFEPFFTTRSNGTGLGLAVARAVAGAHAGELTLEPAPRGCRFVLSLPLGADADAPTTDHGNA
ncbi:MAG: PAS domain-containing sensor histidine kinase [Gammaproteobacteria bacterium]